MALEINSVNNDETVERASRMVEHKRVIFDDWATGCAPVTTYPSKKRNDPQEEIVLKGTTNKKKILPAYPLVQAIEPLP